MSFAWKASLLDGVLPAFLTGKTPFSIFLFFDAGSSASNATSFDVLLFRCASWYRAMSSKSRACWGVWSDEMIQYSSARLDSLLYLSHQRLASSDLHHYWKRSRWELDLLMLTFLLTVLHNWWMTGYLLLKHNEQLWLWKISRYAPTRLVEDWCNYVILGLSFQCHWCKKILPSYDLPALLLHF